MGTEAPAPAKHIRLTSHPVEGAWGALPIHWGRADPKERGPIVGSTANRSQRNVIGTHSGSYGVYRALAVAAGALTRGHKPDLTNTAPTDPIGPYPAWGDPDRIVSMDPFGATVADVFRDEIAAGYDIRPTIAVTKAHIDLPEVRGAMAAKRLAGRRPHPARERFRGRDQDGDRAGLVAAGRREAVRRHRSDLRRALFEETGGMYPELVTRGDLEVFLPPIGGQTAYVFGDPKHLADPSVTLTARVHDECNGSDVFGSDICTCRPYLTHSIEECIRGAQAGGVGLVVYCRKEGRALGEVTKFLVYNARKRQVGGDSATNTSCAPSASRACRTCASRS
jgi:GTP cyclohydrolase II